MNEDIRKLKWLIEEYEDLCNEAEEMREKTVERENMKEYSPGVGFLLLPRVERGVNPRDMKVFRPGIIQFVC
mgnify:CR=1 FL=1